VVTTERGTREQVFNVLHHCRVARAQRQAFEVADLHAFSRSLLVAAQAAVPLKLCASIEHPLRVLDHCDGGGITRLSEAEPHHAAHAARQKDGSGQGGRGQLHSGATSAVKAASTIAVENTASSGSRNSRPYSSENLCGPSCANSSCKNSALILGHW